MTKVKLIIVTVPGRPVAKGRPRLGKGGHVFTPEKTRDAEAVMQAAMREECSVPLQGPLEVCVYFCFKRPSSWPKARRDAVDDGAEPWYTGKPDLDNLVKILDAGNGILWEDDAQVVQLEAYKMYSSESGTQIQVRTLDEH